MTLYVTNPIIILTPGTTGGPVSASPGGLVGVELLGVEGAACVVSSSPDGVTWTPVVYPHTVASGHLRFVRGAQETAWSIVLARIPAVEPVPEWLVEDDFNRASLGSGYTVAPYGDAGRVDAAQTVPPGLLVHFPAFTGNSTGDAGTVITLVPATWDDPYPQFQAALEFTPQPYQTGRFDTPHAVLRIEGTGDSVVLDIAATGEAYMYMYNAGDSLGSLTVPSPTGLWDVAIDPDTGFAEVRLNGALIMRGGLPGGYAASMGGQGRIVFDLNRWLPTSGNRTQLEASILLSSLRVRSGAGRSNPAAPYGLDVMSVAIDPGLGWCPSNYQTIGTEIFGVRDNAGDVRPLPGSGVLWGGAMFTEISHNSNGGLVFVGYTATDSGRNDYNALKFSTGTDWAEHWQREVVDAQGIAWIINHGPQAGAQGGAITTIRANHDGTWIMTTAVNPHGPLNAWLAVNGEEFAVTIPGGITLADPDSWHVVVLRVREPVVVGGMTVAFDRSRAWFPSDYQTIGAQIFGARDEEGGQRAIPSGGSVTWGGTAYTTLSHNPNGGLAFSGANVVVPTPPGGIDVLMWSYGQDRTEVSQREVVDGQGIGWIVTHAPLVNPQGTTLTSVRANTDGSWVLTTAANPNPDTYARLRINDKVFSFLIPTGITLADPTSWHVVTVTP